MNEDLSCFSHMLHCSPHHNSTIYLHSVPCEVRKQQVEQMCYPRLPSFTQVPCSGKSQGLMGSSRHKWGKTKHCPPCADWPASWLGGKCFWRIDKSHLSTEILDPAPPQVYSSEGTSNCFPKRHFLDLLS